MISHFITFYYIISHYITSLYYIVSHYITLYTLYYFILHYITFKCGSAYAPTVQREPPARSGVGADAQPALADSRMRWLTAGRTAARDASYI